MRFCPPRHCGSACAKALGWIQYEALVERRPNRPPIGFPCSHPVVARPGVPKPLPVPKSFCGCLGWRYIQSRWINSDT